MHDDCGCGHVRPEPEADHPQGLTRRRVLLAGAAAGGVVAFRGVPALGQEGETGHASSGSSSTTSTTTTTTAPAASSTPSTTSPRPAITEPAHGDEATGPTGRMTAAGGYDIWLSESPNRGIMFPVSPASATTWNRNQDTYGAPRGGPSGRHQGEDLMAPKMTKLLAVTNGTVVELRHRPSGNMLYIRGDDGWYYGYLHINNDSAAGDDGSNPVSRAWGPGLRQFAKSGNEMQETAARGYRVRQGEVVAYCGDSGNAESTGPHLHFEIRKPASSLWEAPSVNPRESLRNAKPPREASTVPPETYRPWTTARAFLIAQYRDFLGREPREVDLSYYGKLLDDGARTPDWFMNYLLQSDEGDSMTQAIVRLYQAFYRRLPDTPGLAFWLSARRSGSWSLYRIAEHFSGSEEFSRQYGSLDNGQYVDLVYRNVLGRPADDAGRRHWVGQLDSGVTRGRVMVGFTESDEYKDNVAIRTRMDIVGCYGVMNNRIPTSSELSAWTSHINGGGSTLDMIAMLRQSSEYATAAKA